MNKQKPLFHVLCLALLLPLLALSPVQGADSTSFDPTKVAVKAKGAGGVPVGTIIAWPVSRNPEDIDKWLECNGQSVSSAVYPELYAVVGGSVPDFRGLFLRGVGGNSAPLGSAQGDAIRNITGGFGTIIGISPANNGAFEYNHHGQSHNAASPGYDRGDYTFDASRVVPTAEENRPVNRAVRYLVRAKP